MRKIILAFFLILPVLVPVGMIAYHAMEKGTQWEIPVTGYDPRDVLRGRYIIFRYNIGIEDKKYNQDYADIVVCLNGDRENYTVTEITSDLVEQCDAWIEREEIFSAAPARYYIPESIADRADALMRTESDKIKALVRVKNGRIQLETLLADGINITEYIKDQSIE